MRTIDDDEIVGFTHAPSEQESLSLTELGVRLYVVDSAIADAETLIERLREEKRKISHEDLPRKMQELGQDNIGLPSQGVDLRLEPYYHANIAASWEAERKDAAFRYLEDSGNGDLIKTNLVISFPRRAKHKADWLLGVIDRVKQLIESEGGEVHDVPVPSVEMTVPWNTLTAFVREQVESGEPIDLDVLGATVGSVVKIKKRKS